MKLSWPDVARGFLSALTVAALGTVAGCTSAEPDSTRSSTVASEVAHAEVPANRVTVLAMTDPAELALRASEMFFSTAPVVVIARADDPRAQATAAAAASAVTGPVLLVGGSVSNDSAVTELRRLSAATVVEVGPDPALNPQVAAEPTPVLTGLEGIAVVHLDSNALDDSGQINARDLKEMTDQLPHTEAPKTLHEVLALVEDTPGQVAAVATARAAGAWSVVVTGGDPRASAASVESIAEAQALQIVGIGPSFGSADELEWKVDAAQAGAELPGGGQLVFPGKRVITTPGVITTPSAVATTKPAPSRTEPSAIASLISTAQDAANAYNGATPDTVVAAVEIPATTVSTSAGPEGDFSKRTPAEAVQPVLDAAAAAGVYVVLRFEPGKATFAAQLDEYSALLNRPGVGVALNVSTLRGSSARQNGTVAATELNDAFASLSRIVREKALPQKLVVIQQDRPGAITDQDQLDVGDGELAVVLDVSAARAATAQSSQWTKNLTGAPVGTHGGWTTIAKDPSKEAATVAKLTPAPDYVAGSH